MGDVRGKGLMIGIELVTGDGSTDPLPSDIFTKFWDSCKDMRLILGKGGIYGNVCN